MSSVKLCLPSGLLFKDARRQKLWGAVHALITNALKEEEEDALEEGQVEEGQVEQDEGQTMVEVTFWESYLEDPSGMWTSLLQREGTQSNLEYDVQNNSIVGMSEAEAQAFHDTNGFSPSTKLCFNCHQPGHEAAHCPLPPSLERKRPGSATRRYHEPEKLARFRERFRAGQLSQPLKQALGVQEDPFVEIRRRLGRAPTRKGEEDGGEDSEEEERACQFDVPNDPWSARVLPLCACATGDCPRQAPRFTYQPPPPSQQQPPSPTPAPDKRARMERRRRSPSPPPRGGYRDSPYSAPSYPAPPSSQPPRQSYTRSYD